MARGERDDTALAFAVRGLPRSRQAWGRAMRAEASAIDDTDARREFARSAAAAAFWRGHGVRLVGALSAGAVVAISALIASRLQFESAQPGLMAVTVPVPALVLLTVVLAASIAGGSVQLGLETGVLALISSAVAVAVVVAVEGLTWMAAHGVFILDGDPPKGPIVASDVVWDLFTTGLWVGHLVVWVIALAVGAMIGLTLTSLRRTPA